MSKAFVIVSNPVIRWPVGVCVPADDGRIEEWQFTGVFRVLSEEEFEVWGGKPALGAATVEGEVAPPHLAEILANNAIKFAEVMVGWDGVVDSRGEQVQFSADMLRSQINGPHGRALSIGINNALRQIRYGVAPDQPGAVLGNSAPPPAAG